MTNQKNLIFIFILLVRSFSPLNASRSTVDYNGNPINKNGITLTSYTSSAIIASSTQALNQDGLLDNTFGNQGIVTTNFIGIDIANAVALQSDGKIIVVGGTNVAGAGDFALARYTTNGSLDTTFGTGGKVTTTLSAGSDIAYAVALQQDGKILVAGGTDSTGTGDFALVRYNHNGSLDTTFNPAGPTPGVVTLSLSTGIDTAYGIAIQPNGAIVMVGGTDTGNTGDLVILRYTSTGTPDTTFNGTGQVIKNITTGLDTAYSVFLQPNGSIVAAGAANTNSIVVRYTSTGILDTTFNGTGIQTTGITAAYASLLQPNGKIIAIGNNGATFGLVRYNPNGSLDDTFGTAGIVTTVGTNIAYGALLQPDGKIIVVGNNLTPRFALTRYNENGSLDVSFGTNGIVITETTRSAAATVLQPNYQIITVGENGADFTITRYINLLTLTAFTESYGSIGLL